VAALALLLTLPAAADFYRYTDAEGQMHYVDDPRHIPDSRLDTMRVYKEEQNGVSPADTGQDKRRRQTEDAAAVSIDADAKGRSSPTPAVVESPVIVRGNQVLVPVEVGHLGRKTQTNLLLDTGASFTILHQRAARRIMLVGWETREAVVVGGSRIPIRIAEADYIRIGPYRITNPQIAIIQHRGHDQGYHGLLGMDILRALDYTLDVNRGVIVWNR
jgi:predicted aspartyl protease